MLKNQELQYKFCIFVTHKNKNIIMRKLTVSKDTFNEMLLGFIQSGVTFEALEKGEDIVITFLGGY